MKNEDTSYCKQSGIINMTDKATYLYDTLTQLSRLKQGSGSRGG